MEIADQSFTKGELVWAKISGYPWWPGAIVEVDANQKDLSISTCLVKFFGENSHSVLPLLKVVKYSQYYSEYSKKANSNRKLKDSIEIAENIINGNLSVENELNRVKVNLQQPKIIKHELKTTVSIEDLTKEYFEIESTQISCCPSACAALKNNEPAVKQSFLAKSEMTPNDWQVLQEIEKTGIDERNVVDLLEYGVIKRLASINKKRAHKMNQTAKKILMKKYFPKFLLKNSSFTQQSTNQKQKKQKLIKILKTKPIQKQPKQPKIITPKGQVQSLCVKRLFNILKIYKIQSCLCRSISLSVIQKLKTQHPLQSIEFQKSYISFIEWLKQNDNPKRIQGQYNTYFQTTQHLTTYQYVMTGISVSC